MLWLLYAVLFFILVVTIAILMSILAGVSLPVNKNFFYNDIADAKDHLVVVLGMDNYIDLNDARTAVILRQAADRGLKVTFMIGSRIWKDDIDQVSALGDLKDHNLAEVILIDVNHETSLCLIDDTKVSSANFSTIDSNAFRHYSSIIDSYGRSGEIINNKPDAQVIDLRA